MSYVPRDEHTQPIKQFPGGSIESLDSGNYYPRSLGTNSQVRNRHGEEVRDGAESQTQSGGRVILAALDFSRKEHVESVLAQAKASSNENDTVILLNVLNSDKDKGHADQRVKEICALSREFAEGTRVFTHVVYGKPEDTLLGTASKHNANLIILGKRNLKGLKKLTTTSVSSHVIEGAQCSVLIAK